MVIVVRIVGDSTGHCCKGGLLRLVYFTLGPGSISCYSPITLLSDRVERPQSREELDTF